MSITLINVYGFASAAAQIVARNLPVKMVAPETCRKICLAGVLVLLAGISLPGRADYIDNFATGPQSFLLLPGDTSSSGSVSDLDPNQLIWGYRNIWVAVDQQFCGFRPLEQGGIAVDVSGSAPGSFSVQWGAILPDGETPYEPGLSLSYSSQSSGADWTAFDRIVFTFTTPPTLDLSIDTTVGYDVYTSWTAVTTVPAGSQSATILFSDLSAYQSPAFTGTNVMSCWFSFNFPIAESFVLGDIQVTGSAAPPLPSLNAALSGSGVTLSWPTNATAFSLQHTTALPQAFIAVTNTPDVVGTNYSVTLPCACPSEFFCLKRSP